MKPCSHPATLPRHPAIQFKDKSERSVLLSPCTHFWEFCHSLGFGTTAVSGDSRDSVDFLVVVPLQTTVIRFAHAPFAILLSCSRVCPVLHLPSPIQTTLSALHECNIITWRDIQDHINYRCSLRCRCSGGIAGIGLGHILGREQDSVHQSGVEPVKTEPLQIVLLLCCCVVVVVVVMLCCCVVLCGRLAGVVLCGRLASVVLCGRLSFVVRAGGCCVVVAVC